MLLGAIITIAVLGEAIVCFLFGVHFGLEEGYKRGFQDARKAVDRVIGDTQSTIREGDNPDAEAADYIEFTDPKD